MIENAPGENPIQSLPPLLDDGSVSFRSNQPLFSSVAGSPTTPLQPRTNGTNQTEWSKSEIAGLAIGGVSIVVTVIMDYHGWGFWKIGPYLTCNFLIPCSG
jgi:hypothetical protein